MPNDAIKLPLNCEVNYLKGFLSNSESALLYQELIALFKIDTLFTKINVSGETIISKTGKIMFLDKELFETNKFPEEIWGKTSIWSKTIIDIKNRVEIIANKKFQVCVCIYYPDGNTGVGFHSDYTAFGDTSLIPSLSIGEEREFQLREIATSKIHKLNLKEGSLLIMGKDCQQNYEHSLPINSKYKKGRINLTFRPYGYH